MTAEHFPYEIIIFDMDGTLAESKGPIASSMAHALTSLLKHTKVAVISGGLWEQFENQLINFLPNAFLENLSVLPTSGTQFYSYKNQNWKQVYKEIIPEEVRSYIKETLAKAVKDAGFEEKIIFGDLIEDRESQITFSGLGNKAPLEEKILWDKSTEKRKKIISLLPKDITETYTVTIGGTTSIDITMRGIDKAYGIKKLHTFLSIPYEKMLFVGDKLTEGGNDYPAKSVLSHTLEVKDPEDTLRYIDSWIKDYSV